jgi:hypothetical protein
MSKDDFESYGFGRKWVQLGDFALGAGVSFGVPLISDFCLWCSFFGYWPHHEFPRIVFVLFSVHYLGALHWEKGI